MTKVIEKKSKCISCGRKSTQSVVISTNTYGGAPDLDTRPAEMKRSTINYWVQRCPKCGYCSNDSSKGDDKVKSIIRSVEYQEQLNSPAYSELANSFLCYTIIQEQLGDYKKATWASLHAAWVCDDLVDNNSARNCRLKAIDLFHKVKECGLKMLSNPEGADNLIIVDLLRRSGQFERALESCKMGLSEQTEKLVIDILTFQSRLAQNKDIACYRINIANT